MTAKKYSVSVEEYAMLRNLESVVGSIMRLQFSSIRQLQKSWLWNAMQEQYKTLLRHRAENALTSGRQETE